VISSHVLDTASGRPAPGVRVELYRGDELLGSGDTDSDGRIRDLAGGQSLAAGRYRLVFHPASPFFKRVELEVELTEGDYHIPLLLSPHLCVIYRGS
jgi:5-hydroxyisourate hydrolase